VLLNLVILLDKELSELIKIIAPNLKT